MSNDKTDNRMYPESGYSTSLSKALLADGIERMLYDKGAFVEMPPFHMDRPKFRWMVRHDIERFLDDNESANDQVENRL